MPLLATAILLSTISTQFETVQPSHLVMNGTSNVGRWRCHSSTLESRLEVPATIEQINLRANQIAAAERVPAPEDAPAFRLRVPVHAIRCKNRVMDREMSRSLRGEQHPVIEFELREILGAIRYSEPDRYSSAVAGELTVAGVKRRVSFAIDAWRLSPASVYVRSSIPLRMSEFGISPPRSIFGLIRAHDEITVQFDLRLSVVSGTPAGRD